MTTPVIPDSAATPGPRTPALPQAKASGLTEHLAAACAAQPRRTLAAWGMIVVLSLVLVGTALHGLTTSAHVVGSTQSSKAEALYDQTVGAAAGAQPTDVIVVSSKTSTVGDANFTSFVGRLAGRVRTAPGVTNVTSDLASTSPLVSTDRHAALIDLHAATDSDIKTVVTAIEAANGSGGFSVAITGEHTVGNDFNTLSASDLKHGELDFGLPIAIVILMLVFGAVVAGLMPVLMAFAIDPGRSGHRHPGGPGVQPVGLHRQHDDRHGPGPRYRLLPAA